MSKQSNGSWYGGYDPNEGLDEFRMFYAQNTCVPGPYRPRPTPRRTPVFHANGLENLFHTTEQLPYMDPSKPSVGVVPLQDSSIRRYDLWESQKERCGCGSVKIPMPQ